MVHGSESRERTRDYLERAASFIPPSSAERDPALELYHRMLDHDELVLALVELETIGERNPMAAEFWAYLRDAALEMKLDVEAKWLQRRRSEAGPASSPGDARSGNP